MMKSFAMGAVSLLILLGAQDSVRSWTGEDPAPAFPCVFSSTAVSGYSKGARTYEFVASCSDWTGSFVARGSWDPVSKKSFGAN
jgi:hypothetical protein